MQLFLDNILVVYAVLWAVTFYLFGMQRASLLICREAGIEWKAAGPLILPSWFYLAVLPRYSKWGLLIFIFYSQGWQAGLICLSIDALLTCFLPIPYRLLYSRTFWKRYSSWIYEDVDVALATRQMLEDAGYTLR